MSDVCNLITLSVTLQRQGAAILPVQSFYHQCEFSGFCSVVAEDSIFLE